MTEKPWDYGQLTVDDIVDCALRLIERHGVAKLTMRRLAEELGMSSMITYYYVKSKTEMLDLIIERIWHEIPVPEQEVGGWADRLRELALHIREALIKYPGLVQVMQTRPLSPSARARAEFADQMLLDVGMDETLVYGVTTALYHYIFGAIAWEVQARVDGAVDEDELTARYSIGLDVVLEGIGVAVASNRFRSHQPRTKRRSIRKS